MSKSTMTLEDRIERLEKIILVLEPRMPQSRYAREEGLKSEDVRIARDLLADIKKEQVQNLDLKLSCKYFDCQTKSCGRGYELDCDNCMHFRTF